MWVCFSVAMYVRPYLQRNRQLNFMIKISKIVAGCREESEIGMQKNSMEEEDNETEA